MAAKKRPDLRAAMGRLADRAPASQERGHAVPPSPRPTRPGPEDKLGQFGRNRDPNYQQLNFNVPKGLRRRFKAKLQAEGKLMQDVLTDAIRDYVGDFLDEIPDYPSGLPDA